jgi:hypothetical protein
MAGEVVGAKRPRYEANERFDTQDAEAASRSVVEQQDALTRALVVTPKAVGGTAATGLILTGFSITANPTGPSDGRVRIGAELGVAVDADGRLIIKPAGTTVDVIIPTGSQQIYAHHLEDGTDLAARRKITPATPHTEVTASFETSFQSTHGFHVRAGTNSNIVAENAVAGRTRALVFIGLATNTAGAVTLDLSSTLNRLATVVPPSSLPSTATTNGAPKTLHDLMIAVAHGMARDRWKGARTLNLPGAAVAAQTNNFHAWIEPAGGIDQAVRGLRGAFTIGSDAAGIFGDFSRGDFASDDALLNAAIAALPAGGGTIIIKQGITLDNFLGPVTVPINQKVVFVGSSARDPNKITFSLGALGRFQTTTGSSDTLLRFEDCTLYTATAAHTGNFVHLFSSVNFSACRSCFVCEISGQGGSALIDFDAAATSPGRFELTRCLLSVLNGYSSAFAGQVWISSTGTTPLDDVWLDHVDFVLNTSTGLLNGISILNLRDSFSCVDCTFSLGSGGAVTSKLMSLTSSNNTAAEARNRRIARCSFSGVAGTATPNAIAMEFIDVAGLSIDDVDIVSCRGGIRFAATIAGVQNYDLRVADVRMDRVSFPTTTQAIQVEISSGVTAVGFCFNRIVIHGTDVDQASGVLVSGAGTLTHWSFVNCQLFGCLYVITVRGSNTLATENCVFDAAGFVDLSPPGYDTGVGAGTSITNGIFRNNTLRGGWGTATQSNFVFGFRARASIIRFLKVVGNAFHVQDTVYSGSLATKWHVIRIETDNGASFQIDDNEFAGFDGVSHTVNVPAVAISVGSLVSGVTGGNISVISVCRNICETTTVGGANLGLFITDGGRVSIFSCLVSGNVWNRLWNFTGASPGSDIVIFATGVSQVVNAVVSNNIVRIQNNLGFGAPPWASVEAVQVAVQNNHLSIDTIGWGNNSVVNVWQLNNTYVTVTGNSFLILNDLTANNAKAKATAVAFTGTSNPTVPAVSSYFSNNINLQRLS